MQCFFFFINKRFVEGGSRKYSIATQIENVYIQKKLEEIKSDDHKQLTIKREWT